MRTLSIIFIRFFRFFRFFCGFIFFFLFNIVVCIVVVLIVMHLALASWLLRSMLYNRSRQFPPNFNIQWLMVTSFTIFIAIPTVIVVTIIIVALTTILMVASIVMIDFLRSRVLWGINHRIRLWLLLATHRHRIRNRHGPWNRTTVCSSRWSRVLLISLSCTHTLDYNRRCHSSNLITQISVFFIFTRTTFFIFVFTLRSTNLLITIPFGFLSLRPSLSIIIILLSKISFILWHFKYFRPSSIFSY